ncbi:LysR family transcriptional regulator [Cronobacter turicensis]|uniref:LysR family transcriptional regulator n=1 Tax=Cronobacter turicensis TaxID=413502 RepID=UPI0011AD9FEC|nr:LysR family transcriptional regulator [Cronobacter turicensis]EKY3119490.1 LysR family transcriptional regulator [Cronobacter turicensis]ELU8456238.1 LysR family transcriptional regulator [Cronobacter turicensis]ELY4111820.1 LysR family transcriptional regulator [Cronobacter turicensis]ELY4216320.1 LysR family transcriptional regulator [Cronobacter turicensis]EMA1793128.1 LysR family transcriptional regulator [Cronobacter turicensis]
MIRLEDVTLFVRSAALGSFSSAAREADILPGQVSAAVNRLERDLNKRLFARSTRSLRLTAEGEAWLPYAQEMLNILQAGAERLQGGDNEIQGELKIAVPSDIGRNVLLPVITAFCEKHPKVSLRIFMSDNVSDVFRDPVDVAIRYGVLENSSYVALPLAEDNRRVLTASPAYLEKHGRPQTLDDLVLHHCLLYTLNGHVYDKWSFPENGVKRQLTVSSRMLCDDADLARRWAVAGMGIAYKSWIDVSADVLAGRLEVLLPEQPGEAVPLNLICPHRKQFSPAIRELHGLLRDHLTSLTALMRAHLHASVKPSPGFCAHG